MASGMKNKIIYLIVLLCISVSLLAENASNVRVQQKDKDIIITYDLSKKSNVRVLISIGGVGNNSFTPLKSVEGDVGNNVRAGQNLKIVWHPLQEYATFVADNVRFKVEALGSYDLYALPGRKGGKSDMETFITADFAYSLAPQTSVGLTLGQTYFGYGWFVNARTNFHLKSATNGLKCDKGGYIDDVLPFYSGNTQASLLVANVGFVIDLMDVSFISVKNRFNTLGAYVGGGYGSRRMLWETVDGQWIEYSPTSHTGFSANIGVIGSIYGLTLKAGVNTINFKYSEFEVGIGWMF